MTIIAPLLALQVASGIPPDAIRPLSLMTLCTTSWGHDRRHVSEAMKRQVAAAAGIPWGQHGAYEFDHRIPRSLGGADAVVNLQAQPWPIARQKDRDEARLHRQVCAGQVDLEAARLTLWNWRP